MGAQQGKSDNEQDRDSNIEVVQPDTRELLKEIRTETVMSDHNLTEIGTNTKRITVANFAKIKIEPPDEEYSSPTTDQCQFVSNEIAQCEERILVFQDTVENQGLYSSDQSAINGLLRPNLPPTLEDNKSLVLNPFSCTGTLRSKSSIEVKKELLDSHCIKNNSEKEQNIDTIDQNKLDSSSRHDIRSKSAKHKKIISNLEHNTIFNPFVPTIQISGDISTSIKKESIENECIGNLENIDIVQPSTLSLQIKSEINEKENSFDIVEEGHNSSTKENSSLIKNPFAFLQTTCNKKSSRKQSVLHGNKNKDKFVSKAIQSELELTSPKKSFKNTTKDIEEDTVQSSINYNEQIIKLETISTTDDVDFYNNTNLNHNCLSNNSTSSLAVNFSSDIEELLSTKSVEDIVSNVSVNSSQESLKHFSIIELSSVENCELPAEKLTVTSTPKNRETPKRNKTFKRRPLKAAQKRLTRNFYFGKVQTRRGKKSKITSTNSNKFSNKDTSFKLGLSKKNLLKNLPKTDIKTRKKKYCINKQIIKKKNSTIDDFPKPFKTEPSAMHGRECITAIELPKPIVLKMETNLNVKNKNLYNNVKYQPYVRLKRLKSEELLVPLKTKRIRNTRKPLSYQRETSETKGNFFIQNAFSLNQRVKLNRFSIDHDYSFPSSYEHYNPPSFSSRLTPTYRMPTNTPNDSQTEIDSKYFSSNELYSLINSSTTDGSSMFSGNRDSGVSSSPPNTLQHFRNSNKSLLIEIAAERAFINNHLMHFGYSPIQFELFNNLNDMNVFLRYLFGSVNIN